jgi:Concanavalin A-like lectin/glucanases superfamily
MVKRIVCLCFGIVFGVCSVVSQAQESLCAEVKIEILQEVTLERQGFEALMRITNSLDTFSLENVSVKVTFADADGNAVIATSESSASNAAFFIRVNGTRDVTGFQQGASGLIEGGVIAPKKVGELRWLIIPTAKAAGQTKDGKLFFVGAELKYSYGGKDEVVTVAADSIVVKPQPALTLDYFLTQEVVGDNGFTAEIEPAEPYSLGVRISNNGFGFAKSVKIESAQPTIVENKQGLAVGFKIIGSYLGDQPAAPSLLLNFGNIEPKGVTAGRWIMESNLAGEFISFNASFTHADELGGELTSLIEATNAHFLLHDVLVELPGRDKQRDFLGTNAEHELYVYESEVTGSTEISCTQCSKVNYLEATLTPESSSVSQLTHLPQAGFSAAIATDPFDGKKVLSKVVRADGSSVHPQNVWLSKKRAADKIHFNYFVNVFDNNSVGAYTLYWGAEFVDVPQAPVIQFMIDRTTFEGGNVGFIVQATDPNKSIPNLSALQLPVGASLHLSAPNKGVFHWSPQVGQAGIYPIKFMATDGVLTSERSMTIKVNSAKDTDGDGIDDDWERDHFGDLSHDGLADTDGDGRSDLQEFNDKTDPNVLETIPAPPQILSPIFDADTLDGETTPLQPIVKVTNGKHAPIVGAVSIVVEVYDDEGLTALIATATAPETPLTTSIKISPLDLIESKNIEDNRVYYWRAKSQQTAGAMASSAWVKSQFFINTANDLPSVPNISSPAKEAVVAELSPVLSVTNSTDVDRDRLSYAFELFEEGDVATPIATASHIAPGVEGQTAWHLPKVLKEDGRYLWQVTVSDGRGANVKSEWASFLVSTDNGAPTNPTIDAPAKGATVIKVQGDNNVSLSVINSTDPERTPLHYYFELDTVNTFDGVTKRVSPSLTAGSLGKTAWAITDLIENQIYYWRVRAFDGQVYSAWELSEFTLSKANEAPSVPSMQNPANGALVTSLQPLLEVNPSVDPEGKPVTYRFQLFSSADMTTLIDEKVLVNPLWQLDINLANSTVYYWRVRAQDPELLASAWTELSAFTVKLPIVNEKPQLSFVLPNANTMASSSGVFIQWTDSDADSDAHIELFVTDTANNKTSLVKNLDENADNLADQYLWDITGFAAGTYKISAVISDEVSVVTVNHCCHITIAPVSTNPLPSTQWLFDENTGTQTFSAIGNASALLKAQTANGVLPAWIPARRAASASALKFDGVGAYVALPKTTTAPLLASSSMSFWINTLQKGGVSTTTSPAIVGSDLKLSGNDIQWGSIDNQGAIGFGIGDARVLSYTKINNGAWHHVAITRDVQTGSTSGLVKIYVNGLLSAMGMPNHAQFTGLQNDLIGFGVNNIAALSDTPATGSKFFAGALDDVHLYDRVLTEADVVRIFTTEGGTLPPVPPASQVGANGIYQGENATLYLGQVASNQGGYTGTGFADYDLALNSYAEWAVERNVTGPVTLQFRYANGNAPDRPMAIRVNGVVVNSSLSFPSVATNWNTWATVSMVINLNQGINTIRATAIKNSGGPNVDYIKIE